jgi:dipeptidyl aminopeptidase/acylaminoacyl peptidase
MEIEGMLTYPLGYVQGESYPLVLSVHGGPAEYFSQGYFGQPDVYPYPAWASKGYAVLRINPRGSGGYGAAFRKANIADWAGKPYEDLMAGVDAVVAMGVADPDKLAVVGWSYGGFMTANITTRTDRFKAAVVGAGVTDLVSQSGTSDLPDMVAAYMGASPWEDPQLYVSQSPIFAVGAVKTPTLIVHGTDDTRVPISQAQEWYAALRRLGVKTEFVSYPRTGHVVQEPQLLKGVHSRVLEWVGEGVSE